MGSIDVRRIRGMNTWDAPSTLPDDMAQDIVNMDLYDGAIGRKRPAISTLDLTFSAGAFSGRIRTLIRHVPAIDDTAALLFGVDSSATPQIASLPDLGAKWQLAASIIDNISTAPWEVQGISFNNKLFMLYDSAVNRAHVIDSPFYGSSVRRAGMATAAAPTVANTGAGAYAATIRYYKVAYTFQSGGVTLKRGELSPSVSFTPSGAGTAARVTKPAAVNEGETHWELYASADNSAFYLLATTVVGTTTYDDSAAVSSYSTGTAAPIAGRNTNLPSARVGVAAFGHLILGGAWETTAGDAATPKNNRVWFSAPIGDTSDAFYDDEHVPETATQKNHLDLGENDGSGIIAMFGPFDNGVYVFKEQQIWKLVPTGLPARPFVKVGLSKTLGCVGSKAVCEGVDKSGQPALYFIGRKGLYRIGVNGIQYCGKDMRGRWDSVNLSATVVAHCVFDADVEQVCVWVSTGPSNAFPNELFFFDVTEGEPDENNDVRYGWSRSTAADAGASCSVMHSSDVVTPPISRNLKPYVGNTAALEILKSRAGSGTYNSFQAYVDTKPYEQPPNNHFAIDRVHVLAEVATGVTLTGTITPNYGAVAAATGTALLTAAGSETQVFPQMEGLQHNGGDSGMFAATLRLGDGAANTSQWTVNRLVARTVDGGPR